MSCTTSIAEALQYKFCKCDIIDFGDHVDMKPLPFKPLMMKRESKASVRAK